MEKSVKEVGIGPVSKAAFSINIVVKGNPIPKARPRVISGGRITYTPHRTKAWEETVGWVAKEVMNGHAPISIADPIEVEMIFFRESAHACDVDNLIKAVMDGLEGVVFENDRQVCRLTGEKRLDKLNPRVEIWVTRWEGQPNFN